MTTELFRDAWGVPHVRAADHLELARAQGRVTALDRGWQIETDRWRAEGRLAERIGAAGVGWDRFARQARLADTARRAYAALPAADREWVDSYVDGVNGGLPTGRGVPETAALDERFGDATRYEPWPGWAPLGVLVVAHALFSAFPRLLWNAHVTRVLGPSAVEAFDAGGQSASGSNGWALHGTRTASGQPLLAGDPHRALELPGPYQQVRLACPDFDVVGLAFPGVPGVQHFGHTGSVAWGVTNAMAHHVEVFREELRRDGDRVLARGPDGWEETDRTVERIRVRGGRDVEVEVVETARGPVAVSGPDGTRYSLRFPVRVDGDLGFRSLRPLLRARTADEVARALRDWVDPVNRVLTADSTGTVLSLTAGRVPDRGPDERWLPIDAWSEAARPVAWRVLPEPVTVEDVAVDANERPARPSIDLGGAYPSPSRARRLRLLLDERPTWGPDDMPHLHGDTRAGGSTDALLARLTFLDSASRAASAVRDRLLGWDRQMNADSADAGLFAAWRSALVARLCADPALQPLTRPHGYDALLDPWLAVPGRVADALPGLLDADLGIDVVGALTGALEDVADLPDSPWGDRHRPLGVHVLAEVPGCTAPTVPDVPLSGDTECVRCTGSVPSVSDRVARGSVARWVWDLDDRERSRWGVPFGASGDPRSPHFTDQTATWADAGTVPVVTDWAHLTRQQWP